MAVQRTWLADAGMDVAGASGASAGYPFRGAGALARALPFLIIAVAAQVSLVLPPGPQSPWAVLASVVLLLAIIPMFRLPWSRLPSWMPVLVPLTYTGSVLALIIAAGATSGIGIVILVPLIWTALYHRPWESACIVAAIVAVEIITSLTPVPAPGSVIARRVILWALLATVLSVAAHGLRAAIARSRAETELLQERVREVTVLADRDRIAAELHDRVISRIFAVGLTLQGAEAAVPEPAARSRLRAAVDELDAVVRDLRNAVFGLRPPALAQEAGLKTTVLELSRLGEPAAEVSFTGAVDTALDASRAAVLADLLREAMVLLAPYCRAARIDVIVADAALTTTIDTVPVGDDRLAGDSAGDGGPERELTGLQATAAAAGFRLHIENGPHGVRLAWQVPAAEQTASVRPGPDTTARS